MDAPYRVGIEPGLITLSWSALLSRLDDTHTYLEGGQTAIWWSARTKRPHCLHTTKRNMHHPYPGDNSDVLTVSTAVRPTDKCRNGSQH